LGEGGEGEQEESAADHSFLLMTPARTFSWTALMRS
jgi:hypothetical protein